MLRIAAIAICFSFATIAVAEEKPAEKELKGTVTCAKCDLKKADKCATVVTIKDGDKELIYWFDADSHKKYHAAVCTEAKAGTVTGTVKKDGDKWWIKVSKVDYK